MVKRGSNVSWNVEHYTDARGVDPVQEFLDSLTDHQFDKVALTIRFLQDSGITLRMPYARNLGNGLWELRAISSGDIFRCIYFTWTGRRFVLLAGFQKKTDKTPAREIATASRRRTDWLNRHKGTP
jgi:phage-related protein